jgi:glucose-6-phosphate dehydrogenase assembly protein OpcA
MTAAPETFAPGIPVEIAKIDHELKKLWEEASGSLTRASLINLAVYSEEPDSLGRNTGLISEITENHACRAIVIAADPAAQSNSVEAWISAHCHVSHAGRKHVCSEQLSFSLQGKSTTLLPNILFAQLDSDLPLNLWWQKEFAAPMDPQLWAWVDRVIYDSQPWSDVCEQMRLVQTVQEEARQRVVLCDLNWVRLVHLRIALAQFFDHPATHHHLDELAEVEVAYAPGFRSTALLLVGWLAAQLNWENPDGSGESLTFEKKENEKPGKVSVNLAKTGGEPVSCVLVRSATAQFRVAHQSGADLIEASFGRKNGRTMQQFLPAGKGDPVSLVKEELMRGGAHRVYLRAFEKVRAFF